MAELNIDDIQQQYGNTLCFYRGKPCKVKSVGKRIKLLDLVTQRNLLVDFSLKDFSGPRTRLGFVNVDESVVFVSRNTIRVMQVGINAANCQFTYPEQASFPHGIAYVVAEVQSLDSPEVANMLLGHYPALKNAYSTAVEFEGTVAFDKQFAVDCQRNVFFKTELVGRYSPENNTIKFNKNKEHLSFLIGERNGQIPRTFE